MTAQTYRVTSFKVTDFTDNYGNSWVNTSLEGHGEPVTMVVKDPSTIEVGKEFYGSIYQATGKSGKQYWRFKRESQEDQKQPTYHKPNERPAYDQDGQAWGNSVTNAVNLVIATNTSGDPLAMATEALAVAQVLFNGRNDREIKNDGYVHGTNAKEAEINIELDDLNEPVDLSTIPF